MKNVLISGFILMIFLFTYSCTPCSSGDNHEHTEAVQSVKNDKHNPEPSKLVLNNGKPWVTQVEMTVRVNNMRKLLDSFTDTDNVEAYNELSARLTEEFDMIFKECTMTGEAHNQLHYFLIPVKDMMNALGSSDLEKCKQGYDELKNHLPLYDTYFQ